jgi:hypothetical protein
MAELWGEAPRPMWTIAMALSFVAACGGKPPAPPPPCDQACQDGTALRALRETMRVAYNGTLMGQDVGPQDGVYQCLMGGTAHVVGTATSNAAQGSTFVDLTYVFRACLHVAIPSPTPERNYRMVLDGTATESGTIAVQPSATTSLAIKSEAMSFAGYVNDPPIDYTEPDCMVDVRQDGNAVSGFFCGGRTAGFGF